MPSHDADFDMVWEKMWVGRPAGTHFSAGGSSPLARGDDTNRLETHATLGDSAVDDDDDGDSSEVRQAAAGIAVAVLLSIVAVKVAPRVKAWWHQRRARQAAAVEEVKAAEQIELVEPPVTATVAIAHFAEQVDSALSEQPMSSEETQRRILEVMLAAAVIADNMRALADAWLDIEASAQLQDAFDKLVVPEVTASLDLALKMNSDLLDVRASADVFTLFGGGHNLDGRYVPIGHAKVREALRLPFAA